MDDLINKFNVAVTETANETLGKCRHQKQPWVTLDIFHLCNKRRELKKDKFTTEGAKQYKAVNQQIKKGMVKARETWIEERCQEIDDSLGKNNSKKAYQLVKDLTSSKQGRSTTIQDKNRKCLTEDKDILNRWTEYCSELYNHKAKGDPEVLKHPPVTNIDSHPILWEEVEAAVKSLKPGKSAGVDNIPAELLQAGGETMIDVLLNICNKIWQTGEWPMPWTQSLVITLPKKGNLLQCQNYRTIILISHASKVMLKILLNRLTPQAETIIVEEQAGFRPGRSTTEQIFSLRILCEKYLQHQQDLFHVFVDFKKAFDRVWHAALWSTMKLCNMNANVIRVIESLYSKATSTVYYNGSVGEWFRTTVGVRQGCLLSPTLFNFFFFFFCVRCDDRAKSSGRWLLGSPPSAVVRQLAPRAWCPLQCLLAKTVGVLSPGVGRSEECAQGFAPQSHIHSGLNQQDLVSLDVFSAHSDQYADGRW